MTNSSNYLTPDPPVAPHSSPAAPPQDAASTHLSPDAIPPANERPPSPPPADMPGDPRSTASYVDPTVAGVAALLQSPSSRPQSSHSDSSPSSTSSRHSENDPVSALPPLARQPPPRRPPTSDSSGSMVTVTSSATRAVIPTTAMAPPPTDTNIAQKKVVFTNLRNVPFDTFYGALRSYHLDEHVTHLTPLRDESGYIITCSSARVAQQFLHRPLPAAIAQGEVRLPRPTATSGPAKRGPDTEFIIHAVHTSFPLPTIKRDLETTYGVHPTYINRLHRRTPGGNIDFATPAPHIRVRIPHAEVNRILAEPHLKILMNKHKYTVTGIVPAVPQCRRCFSLSHDTRNCPSTLRCLSCNSAGHRSEDCPQPHPICANCHGPHRPTYGGCPSLKQARLSLPIQRIPQPQLPRHLLSDEPPSSRPPNQWELRVPPKPQRPPNPRSRFNRSTQPAQLSPLENTSYPTRLSDMPEMARGPPHTEFDEPPARSGGWMTNTHLPEAEPIPVLLSSHSRSVWAPLSSSMPMQPASHSPSTWAPPSPTLPNSSASQRRTAWGPTNSIIAPQAEAKGQSIPTLVTSLRSIHPTGSQSPSAFPQVAPDPASAPAEGQAPPLDATEVSSAPQQSSPFQSPSSFFKAILSIIRVIKPIVLSYVPPQYRHLVDFILQAIEQLENV